MSDQVALWQQIESIKRRVQGILGEKPPRNFRSTFVYQNYTATCGEAFWAYKNQELDEDLLRMLQKDADKLIENWKNQ